MCAGRSLGDAREQAQANANQTGENWVLSVSSSLRVYIERESQRPREVDEIFYPVNPASSERTPSAPATDETEHRP